MKHFLFTFVIVLVLVFMLVGCTDSEKTLEVTDEQAAVNLNNTGIPGPVTLEVACDVVNNYTWIAHQYDETVIAITDISYELGNPGKATMTITPVAEGETTALFVYCIHGMVEAGVKGFAEYKIKVDENDVITYKEERIHFESQHNPGIVADAGAQDAPEDAVMGAVYEDVGEDPSISQRPLG